MSVPKDVAGEYDRTMTAPTGERTDDVDADAVPSAPVDRNLSGCAQERYALEGERARGGIGRIVAMRDRKLDRTVAVKELMSPSATAKARFFREASITARLEHPGIVPVHESGTWPDGRPFYAMKMVAGQSLAEQITSTPALRDRLALIANLLAVAEAIAYAHSEGVVHRDLKPSNVMVGAYGETVVVDWGLAKQLEDDVSADARTSAEPTADGDADLTRDGDVLGTPSYMAPEQARGEAVDETADVYALGAILYAILAGRSPYRASPSHETMQLVLNTSPEPISTVAPVRPELAAIVAKAMARNPWERYSNASEFRDDLASYQAGRLVRAHHYTTAERLARGVKRARWPIAVVAVVGLAGLAAYGLLRGADALADLCNDSGDEFAAAWNPGSKQTVQASLLATGVPYAEDTAAIVRRALDDHAAAYATAYSAACDATAQRGQQSVELFDLRMHCLQDRLDHATALIDVFAAADEAVVKNAAQAVAALPGFGPCGDAEYLTRRMRPPADPETAAAVRAANQQLSRTWALRRAGRWDDALANAAGSVASARATGYSPIIAEALRGHGAALSILKRLDEATPLLEDAYYQALAAGAPIVAYRSAVDLAAATGSSSSYDDSRRWARAADALIAGTDNDPYWRAVLERQRGYAARRVGDFETALAHLVASLDHLASATGPGVAGERAQSLSVLAGMYLELRRFDEALATAQQSVAAVEASVGPRHPTMALALNFRAMAESRSGDNDAAQATFRESIAIYEDVLGADHPNLASAINNLALLLNNAKNHDDALALARRALSIWEAHHGPSHVDVADACIEIGVALKGKGELADAETYLARALSIRERALGAEHPHLAQTRRDLATVVLANGAPRRAEQLARAALATLEVRAPRARRTATAYELVADTLFAQDRFSPARELYRRALDVYTSREDKAWMRFRIATTRASAAPASAVKQARAVLTEQRAEAEPNAKLIEEIEAWLAERAAGPR